MLYLYILAAVCVLAMLAIVVFLLWRKQSRNAATAAPSWTFQGCWNDTMTDPNNTRMPADPARALPNFAPHVRTFEECQQFTIEQKADVMAFQESMCRYGNQSQDNYRRYGPYPQACRNTKNGSRYVNPVYTLN